MSSNPYTMTIEELQAFCDEWNRLEQELFILRKAVVGEDGEDAPKFHTPITTLILFQAGFEPSFYV